jgi:serine/threonine-protein kinase
LSTHGAESDTSRPHEVKLVVGAWPDESPRYELLRVLGKGGMGEVTLGADRRIGRDVAVKTIHPEMDDDAVLERFLREARIQGQLEHPSIVPVYDLARTVEGQFYFTMKRVQGKTLRSALSSLRAGDPEARESYPLRRLLAAFDRVCLAVAFAHSRGVVHRDLKPDNVMLGEFGEVYVLDWGLAKVTGAPEDRAVVATLVAPAEGTSAGAVLGTLGYMAAEQLRSAAAADPRSDVYALGAILFEILTLERLHRGDANARARSTFDGVDVAARICDVDRDIPPELEAVCIRATAHDAAERLSSARELHDAVERYLDHDRDTALRRASSAQHASAAADAAEHALAGSEDDRRRALREAGRALALDPSNEQAMRTMTSLLFRPPDVPPREVAQQLEEAGRRRASAGAKLATASYLSLCLYVPLLMWMGVRSWPLLGALYAAIFALSAASYAVARWARQNGRIAFLLVALNALVVAATTTVAGPLLVAPGFAAATSLGIALYLEGYRKLTAALGCLAVVAPLGLEFVGALPPSYLFSEAGMLVVPRMVELPRGATLVFLVMSSVTTIGITTFVAARMRDALTDAERRLVLHAWQLQHVIPDALREGPEQEGGPSHQPTGAGGATRPRDPGPCLTEDEVVGCLAGRLDATKLERVELHIDACESCRELVSALARTNAADG